MTNVISLAEKKDDSRLWSPEDAAQDLLKTCREKNIVKMMTIYEYKTEDGGFKTGYVCQGVNKYESAGMLLTHAFLTCRECVEL